MSRCPRRQLFVLRISLNFFVSHPSHPSHPTGSGSRSASTADPRFAGDSNAWTHHPSEFGKIRLLRSLVLIGIEKSL